MQKGLKLIGAIVVCQLVGGLGALVTTPAISGWYADLIKPSFNPPNWIFGPVWIGLYLLMGIAWWRADKAGNKLFLGQLGVNWLWSMVFFGLKQPWFGVGVIVILWGLIWLTMKKFMRLSRLAGWLLLPYLLWVSFATILNIAVAILN
ncbi:MAG: TspO/MBR family protein [Candidatus Beckwithbacteria bacterium]